MSETTRTRFRGWHVRNYRELETDRGVAYNCEIWRNDQRAGDARNDGRGGMDFIQLNPTHRTHWEKDERYYNSQPDNRGNDGDLATSETGLFQMLCDLFEADQQMARARRRGAKSGLAGYTFRNQYGFIHTFPEFKLFRTDTPPPDERLPAEFVRYLIMGEDNTEIRRFVSAPESAPDVELE